uniref:Uncharacterized protein n=1 Tax=Arundo donax TaxID=35708 RepID=A0A0A8ZVX4_ARUDO
MPAPSPDARLYSTARATLAPDPSGSGAPASRPRGFLVQLICYRFYFESHLC